MSDDKTMPAAPTYEAVIHFGAVGSGKTSGPPRPARLHPEWSGLVLTVDAKAKEPRDGEG